jgi:hypothetical protein
MLPQQEFLDFLNSFVFFNSLINDKQKNYIKELVVETCKRIATANKNELTNVLGNIEFIIYKSIEGKSAFVNCANPINPDGGITLKCEVKQSNTQKSCWRFFIIYHLPKKNLDRETELYILAHEFAHAFFNHPLKDTEKSAAEQEAHKKAVEWGFRIHNDDVNKINY